MGQAHAAASFCFPLEHNLSYLLKNFWGAVSKLAVANETAIKKTDILLADFGMAWSADETGLPLAMDFKNEISTLVLKTPESNPDPLEMTCSNQDG
ncbi:hypothetical protein DSO57_1007135 [Entomophthora muscae]|uniref:Uncharacterized protein n=1 Tax=Entomophthora muscae TaxID=34485 RepID=A0ACC2T7B0_9FUNG|nr:hypothetical protein DSO57_1007135 [Entomophthora muscae]